MSAGLLALFLFILLALGFADKNWLNTPDKIWLRSPGANIRRKIVRISEEKKRIAFRIIKEIKAPILIQYYVSEQDPFYC